MAIALRGRVGQTLRLPMPALPDTAQALHAAIAALQAQRAVLGDAVVEQTVAALHDKLAALDVGAHDPQLKQVTVLFTDVVGSTTLSQHLDPEDIHAAMDGALARFTTIVQVHRGTVLQYAGDSVLAVFGAPQAHEDDAERAVRAGLAILEEGRVQGALVKARHGHDGFNVRVGIHTGGVLLGGGVDGEHSIRGMTVNVAARMEQTAPPGALRISQDTYRQVRGCFELLAQPPLLVKGRDEPMLTYLVQAACRRPDRSAARGVDGVRIHMLGRDRELAVLQQAYGALCGGGRGGLRSITVVGDAGLGKSRLVAEFRHWSQAQAQGALWLQAYASEQHMSQPYGMLRALLTSRTDLLDSDPAPLAREKWLAAAAPHLAGADDAAVLGHLLGLDFSAHAELRGLLGQARQLHDRAFFHASQWLRAWTTQGTPVIALLDDLHWADDGTLDFVEHLAANHPDLPLLLLGPTRPTLYERRADWGRNTACEQRIDLAPLDDGVAGELADALLGRMADVPESLRGLIAERAEGNPFFMEELVNMLLDQGVIVDEGGAWHFQPERLHGVAVPTTLVGVLQARLDALPTDERRTAQLASVVGFRFWDDSLVALGAPLPDALQRLVDDELARELLPSSLAGLHEYAFKHHTLHQVTYDSVLKRLKKGIHAQVARWLVGLPGAAPLDLVAEHFERGGELPMALGYWQRAAELAVSSYANAQALAHADRALALLPPDDLDRHYALLLVRTRALDMLDDRERLAPQLDALQALAERLADPAKLSEALVRRARHCLYGGDTRAGLELARQAVAHAPASDPARGAWAHALAAQCLVRLGRHGEAERESAAALQLARAADDSHVEGTILNDLGMLADERGDHGAAIAYYEQALLRHRAIGNRHNEGGSLSNLGYAAMMLGDYASACEQFVGAKELFAKIGQHQNEGITLINLGMARLNQGRYAEALVHARQALALLRATGNRWAEAAALRVVGQVELALGEAAAAIEHLQASRDLFDGMDMPHLALEAMAGLAHEALGRGDLGAALAQVEAMLARQAAGVSLDGTEEPMRVRLICCQVLAAARDARAPQLLAHAHGALLERADRISDPARRAAYLQDIAHHRQLVAAWRAQDGAGVNC